MSSLMDIEKYLLIGEGLVNILDDIESTELIDGCETCAVIIGETYLKNAIPLIRQEASEEIRKLGDEILATNYWQGKMSRADIIQFWNQLKRVTERWEK